MGYIGAGPTRFNTADELTVTGDAEFNGDLTVKGTHITLDSATVQTVDLGDNDKIRLGDSDDLQIFHDGSNSYITDSGTGNLYLRATNALIIQSADGGETLASFHDDNLVRLYYDNAIKLATTSTGVDVTGTVTASSVGVGAAPNATFGSLLYIQGTPAANKPIVSAYSQGNSNNAGFALFNDSGNRGIWTTGSTMRFTRTYEGNSTADVTIDASGFVGIGNTAPDTALDVASSGVPIEIRSTNNNTYKIQVGGSSGYDAYWGTTSSAPFIVANSSVSEMMRIDSSGNVGIGNSTPSSFYSLADNLVVGTGSGGNGMTIYSGSSDSGFIGFNDTASASMQGYIQYNHSGDYMTFAPNGTEKMRIDNGGGLFLGNYSHQWSSSMRAQIEGSKGIAVFSTGGSSSEVLACWNKGDSGTRYQVYFADSTAGGIRGSITTNGSSTAYNTTSDYRLKTAVNYDWDATTRLKQLRPARFEWIVDGDDAVPVDGFLAHEVQDIVPEAISGTKDGMRNEEYTVSAATGDIYTPAIEAVLDEDGNEVTPAVAEVIHSADVERPDELAEGQQWRETTAAVMGTRSVPDYQGIDQSKLVPLLVKTIQELEARIVALETA